MEKAGQLARQLQRSGVTRILPTTYGASCKAVRACRERYGSGERFMVLFNPSEQARLCKDERRAFAGDAPTLAVLADAFGEETAEAWVEIQLHDLSEYCGCREKLSTAQGEQAAQVIVSQFGSLRATELMAFMLRFKAGAYGKFYGAVDGIVITDALQTFMKERLQIHGRLQREADEERRKEEAAANERKAAAFRQYLKRRGMSIDEWLQEQRESRNAQKCPTSHENGAGQATARQTGENAVQGKGDGKNGIFGNRED